MLFSISYVLYVSIWNWEQIKVWKVDTFVLILCQKSQALLPRDFPCSLLHRLDGGLLPVS